MQKKIALCVVAASCVAATFADDDPYASYVKLTRRDTSGNTSWNIAGGWSDGMAPTNTKNYYVASGATLYRDHNTTDTNRVWSGGQLVLAGIFYPVVSAGDKYAPYIPDLVLLPGAHIQTACYGPLYTSPSGQWGQVTVMGTEANPSRISQYYRDSFTSTGTARSYSLTAKFFGTGDSYLTLTRPMKNGSTVLQRGFYCRAETATFTNYPGTFKVYGSNTIFKLNSLNAFNWPNTAFVMADGADVPLSYGDTYNNNTKNAYFRSFEATGAIVTLNYNASANAVFPILNVTNNFAISGGTTLKISNCSVDKFIRGIAPDRPNGEALKIAHLTGEDATVGDITDLSLFGSGGFPPLVTNVTLLAVDAGGGAKDVYIAAPGIVTMTNTNVETSGYPAGSTAYGAFEPGHAGDWSNLVTPPADSDLHYWAKTKLCFFQSVNMPNATLTLGSGSSTWKGGTNLTFKEVNICQGVTLGLWSNDRNRTLTADRLNLFQTSTSGNAGIFMQQGLVLNVNADLCGNIGFTLNNINNSPGTVNLTHVNTNFHGRISISQRMASTSTAIAKYQFNTTLNDARNLGGTFTQDTNTYNAVFIYDFPVLIVTNDVDFCEPTRGMFVRGGAKFDVAAGKTMRLANQVTYAGEIDKAGAGTLELAGTARFIDGAAATAPVATTNVLTVSAGALKVSAKTAADGLAVSFAEGTRLVIPSDSEDGYYNVKWDEPLTINTTSSKLPVEIELTGSEGLNNITVPICTFNATAAANIPETAFAVKKMANGFRLKSMEKRVNGDGSVTYLATLGIIGTQIIFR